MTARFHQCIPNSNQNYHCKKVKKNEKNAIVEKVEKMNVFIFYKLTF
jgi:hypothetical protein